MPYMVEISDEAVVQIRSMALSTAQRLLFNGLLCMHDYLDEARKISDFLLNGNAPLPPEDHEHSSDHVPDDLSELDPQLTGEDIEDLLDTLRKAGAPIPEGVQWTKVYETDGRSTMNVADDAPAEWFGEDVTWTSGVPKPPDDEEEE